MIGCVALVPALHSLGIQSQSMASIDDWGYAGRLFRLAD